MALHLPLSAEPAGPAGAAMEGHLLLLRIATAAGLLLDIRTFGFLSVYFWSQNVLRIDDALGRVRPSYLAVSGRLAEGLRGRGTRVPFLSPLAAARVEALAGKTAAAGWTCRLP